MAKIKLETFPVRAWGGANEAGKLQLVPGVRLTHHFALTSDPIAARQGEFKRPCHLTHLPSGRRLGDASWPRSRAQYAAEKLEEFDGWDEEIPTAAIEAIEVAEHVSARAYLTRLYDEAARRTGKKSWLRRALEGPWAGSELRGPVRVPMPARLGPNGSMTCPQEESEAYVLTHPSGAVAHLNPSILTAAERASCGPQS